MESPGAKTFKKRHSQSFIPSLNNSRSLLAKQWYLQPGAGINAIGAWEITRGVRDIVVAVVDGGFDITHPDLAISGKIVFAKDYVNKKHPFHTTRESINHGTMCSGLAIAETKTNGIMGVANGCSFMPVRIPPDASDEMLATVFEETAEHADVICCSWSPIPGWSPLHSSLYKTLTDISQHGGRRKKGVVVCFSVSNYNAPISDCNNKRFFWLDNETDSFRSTHGPMLNGYAAHPSVIAVAACTSKNRKAIYSNWGKEVSICAPSDNYHPLVQETIVEGRRDVWTTDNLVKHTNSRYTSGYTKQFGGTSSSTALVAGVAALVLSANLRLTAAEVRKILETTTDKIEDDLTDKILNTSKGVYTNEHSEWFGYGKVNAKKAVMQASDMLTNNV